MTIVIGVDPGAKNLALCKISGERILEWDVINIDPSPNGLEGKVNGHNGKIYDRDGLSQGKP